jgi:hypothetical protein
MVLRRSLKAAMRKVFLRATIRVNLDEAHESPENVPTRIARQSDPVGDVEKSLNRHDIHSIAILALSMPLLAGCIPDTCGNEVKQSLMSPSGKLSAVVFSRDCGATTGFSTQVSIIPTGHSLPNKSGNTFVTSGKIDLSLQWQTDFILRIQGEGESVFKQETEVTGVTVKYGNRL